jgi:AraC family transcriptional regulator of adaptative response / DNA-3-methyladenine glycosylase II
VREVFALTPRELRSRARGHGRAAESGTVDLRLRYRAPFDGAALIDFLAARAAPGVEETVAGAYRRSLRLPYGAGIVELRPADGHVHARFRLDDLRDLAAAVQRCRTLLDLDSDPHSVAEILGSDSILGAAVRAHPGRRLPGHVDGDELAVRAVLGQQVSVAGAATLAGRLVRACGEPLERPFGAVTHLFPSAERLAAVDPESLAMPRSRRAAVLALAAALAEGTVALDPGAERDEARRRLLALPGIGPWTADYIAMRALRDPDAFLPSDLGVRRGLEALGQGSHASPGRAALLAERWRPYRAYAVQHLWALAREASVVGSGRAAA